MGKENVNLVKRVVIYCLGLLFLAVGVTFSIKSNLGVSPINAIPYILSLVTEVGQGLLTTFLFSFYVLLQVLILRKEFKVKNLLQIVFASVFGYFVTFSNMMLEGLGVPENYMIRLSFLVISILLVAVGLLLYLSVDIVPQPPEGVMLAISSKIGIELPKIKVIFDCIVVVIAVVISLAVLGTVDGIREGTIISAILIGKTLGIFSKRWKTAVADFAFR